MSDVLEYGILCALIALALIVIEIAGKEDRVVTLKALRDLLIGLMAGLAAGMIITLAPY